AAIGNLNRAAGTVGPAQHDLREHNVKDAAATREARLIQVSATIGASGVRGAGTGETQKTATETSTEGRRYRELVVDCPVDDRDCHTYATTVIGECEQCLERECFRKLRERRSRCRDRTQSSKS